MSQFHYHKNKQPKQKTNKQKNSKGETNNILISWRFKVQKDPNQEYSTYDILSETALELKRRKKNRQPLRCKANS